MCVSGATSESSGRGPKYQLRHRVRHHGGTSAYLRYQQEHRHGVLQGEGRGGSVWSGLSLSTLQAIIDRESELAVYGTFIMEISATEVDTTGTRGQSVLTEVTIIVTVSNKCWSLLLTYLNIKAWHNYLPNGCLTQDTPTPPGSQ